MKAWKSLDVLAAAGCWAAGLYLITQQTQAGNSAFDVLFRGIGIYFLAKGFFVLRALHQAAEQTDLLRSISIAVWRKETREETDS